MIMSIDFVVAIMAMFIVVLIAFVVFLERRERRVHDEAMAAAIHGWLGSVSGIRAATELLLSASDDAKFQKHCTGLAHAADRLRTSLETAMHDARIGAGALRPCVQKTDVQGLLAEIVEHLAPLARIKKVKLTLRCADIPADLSIDRTAFEMAAYNVIENAIKYTDRGCISVNVSVQDEHQLTFLVTDTGCGLPDDIARGVFRKFCRGSSATPVRGSGLGLYVVDQLVHAAGGTLAACRRTDRQGSVMTVTLPIR